jgi:hypothetical protein
MYGKTCEVKEGYEMIVFDMKKQTIEYDMFVTY